MTPLWEIIIWFFIIWAKVCIDFYQIKNGHDILHEVEIGGVIFIGILYGIYVAQIKAFDTYFKDVLIFMIASYGLSFDQLLNLVRGKEWYYLSDSPKASHWDRFFRNNFPLYLGLKTILLVMTIYGVVNVMKHG